MGDSNVIRAFKAPELPEQTFSIATPPAGKPHYCKHGSLHLDPHERIMTCAQCGQVLDPFDFMLTNALTINRAWQDHTQVRRELGDLQERISDLKKDEKRIKAQIKRHADKIVAVDVRGKSVL